MGVLERIESIIRADLSNLPGETESNEKLLGQLIADMESELAEARVQITAAIREGERLRAMYIENEKLAEKWQEKAVLAVQCDRDDLAREALLRKRAVSALAEDYRRECELHEQVLSSLKSALKSLEMKIQDARRRKNELIIHRRRMLADQLLRRGETADKMTDFERIGDEIVSLNAEVEAMAELDEDELSARFHEEELEAELSKLKDKIDAWKI